MKYLVLLGDGMADYPLEELGGKTPLMAARTPHMDFLVKNGHLGRAATIPPGLAPGSDVANLAVMGYDPQKYFTGRAPLEAASLRLKLAPEDAAFRCNLVTLRQEGNAIIMDDFSAGHIGNNDSHLLIAAIHEALSNERIAFFPGVSYRHVMIWKSGMVCMATTPPHDISGQAIGPHLPKGDGADVLLDLMQRSRSVLANHPVNQQRIAAGKKPATSIWLWGQGKSLTIPSFRQKYGCSGAVISAVDLIKGIGIAAGLDAIDVPGVTGFLDTNYVGKAEYALQALKEKDFVYVHVEAPDEASHNGSIRDKIQAIEDFDEKVVGTVLGNAAAIADLRIMVLPDHATPICTMTHASDPIPFIIYPSIPGMNGGGFAVYNEQEADSSDLYLASGHQLMDLFIHGKKPAQ